MANEYRPGQEGVRVTASPNISTVQTRFDTAPTSTLGQLAQALNVAAPAAENAIKTYEAVQTVKGTQDAKGMTLEEQRKLIDNKELMESHSSAYVATVQHMYGQNAMDRAKRETLDGIAKGTLTFESNEALDKYMTDKRNTALSGQSKYTIAGFDKNLDAFTSTVGTVNAERVNSEFVARAAAVRDEHIQGVVAQVTDPTYKGTTEEAAASIMAAFGLTKDTNVLPLAQSKEAFKSMLNSVTERGRVDLMKALLGSSTNNLKVASLIGGDQARLFSAQVDAVATKSQRESLDVELTPFSTAARLGELNLKDWAALRKKHEKIFTDERYQLMIDRNAAALHEISKGADRVAAQTAAYTYNSEAESRMREAVENGNFGTRAAGQRMSAKDGTLTDFDEKEAAAEYLVSWSKQVKMAPDDVIKIFSTNGLVNPELKKEVTAAMGNLGSVGWAYNGKDVGVLSPQAEEGIKKGLRVLEVDPSNLSKYAGSEAAVTDLQNMDMAMKIGGAGGNLNKAATLVNAAKHSGISDTDFAIRSKEIANRVAAMVNPSFYSSSVTGIGNMLERRNEVVNEVQMASSLRKGAEFLLKSGSAATVEEALAAVQKYQARPEVSTVIDNTRYFNTDLPTVPAGANQAAYVKLFKREVIAKDYGDTPGVMPSIRESMRTNLTTAMGMINPALGRVLETGTANDRPLGKSTDGQEIVLQRDPSGFYTAMLGAYPAEGKDGTVLRYKKSEMESWIRTRHAADQAKEVAAGNRELSRKQERAKGQLSGTTPPLSSGVPYSEQ
jgi:hypothetical protein